MSWFLLINEAIENFFDQNMSRVYKKKRQIQTKKVKEFFRKSSVEAVKTIMNSIKTLDKFNFVLLS